jgi:hypothetical protein
MRMRNILSAATLIALQAMPLSAQSLPQQTVQVPLQDLPTSQGIGERLGHLWGALRDSMGLGPSALELASRYAGEALHSDDFSRLMGIAGFKLKSIESTMSLLPGLTLEFAQSRQLSEADREFLERELERHAQRNPGPMAAIQRMIVSGILEANEIQGFAVEKLTVTLLPLPHVRFTLAPVDAPLGLEASRLLSAIEGLNQRLSSQAGNPRAGGAEFDMPPPPLLRRAITNF